MVNNGLFVLAALLGLSSQMGTSILTLQNFFSGSRIKFKEIKFCTKEQPVILNPKWLFFVKMNGHGIKLVEKFWY